MKNNKWKSVLGPALLAAGLLTSAAPSRADLASNEISYTFSGLCTDCAGYGRGVLTLRDYTFGSYFTERGTETYFASENDYFWTSATKSFVSFRYEGSNLMAPFTISAADADYYRGLIPTQDSTRFDFYVEHDYVVQDTVKWLVFTVNLDGDWIIRDGDKPIAPPPDYGTNGTWTLSTTTVPEPSMAMLVGVAVLGLGLTRRRC